MRRPRSILITGASSGIGQALALAYAEPGVTLALGGRNRERLEAVVGRCRELGAAAEAGLVDVTEGGAMAGWIAEADGRAPLELVVANAGIARRAPALEEMHDHVREVFAVNVGGVLNTLHPAIALMAPRRRGQLAVMSSLAGFRGLPGAAAYSASKGTIRLYGEALRSRLAPLGLEVSVVCPGFVRSPITARNRFPMPLLMDPGRAAAIIKRGLARDRARIAFPLTMYALTRLAAALPPGLVDPVLRRAPDKE